MRVAKLLGSNPDDVQRLDLNGNVRVKVIGDGGEVKEEVVQNL